MKKAPYSLCALLAIVLSAVNGHSQNSDAIKSQPPGNLAPRVDTTIRTSRIIGPAKDSNHVSGTLANSSNSTASGTIGKQVNSITQSWGNAPATVERTRGSVAPVSTGPGSIGPIVPTSAMTRTYRVGIGDVLDVRLLDVPTRESTLFTVLSGGLLEYPLIETPVKVEGLSVEEIAARLTSSIKVIDHPRLVVKVRDHASHNVVVTGLVYNPGAKVLRQEAVPLYVVLAEALAREGATRATISRGGQTISVDLADQSAIATLVVNGDLVKVLTAPAPGPQYYYVSGEINSPGEKVFRTGLTLTQSILASGGITQNASGRIRITSTANGASSAASEFNVKEILEGRKPDPSLKPGDRMEVIRGSW